MLFIYKYDIYIYIYPHTRVLSFPGLISVARVNEKRTTDVTRVLKYQVLSFTKMLVVWWTNKKYSVLISVLQSAQWINSERIYPHTRFVLPYICMSFRIWFSFLILYIKVRMCFVRVYLLWMRFCTSHSCINDKLYQPKFHRDRKGEGVL